MGADKGVHVVDDAIAGSDALATSLVLAKAIEKVGDVDLRALRHGVDGRPMCVVPAMLAERLGLPAAHLRLESSSGEDKQFRSSATATPRPR